MAIVLAVIGMIIGAIAIGKDVQRNAEYTKIKNKFIDQWAQATTSTTSAPGGAGRLADRAALHGQRRQLQHHHRHAGARRHAAVGG
jgi:hypothetical protein